MKKILLISLFTLTAQSQEYFLKPENSNYFLMGFGQGPVKEQKTDKYNYSAVFNVQYIRMIDEQIGVYGNYISNGTYTFGGVVGF